MPFWHFCLRTMSQICVQPLGDFEMKTVKFAALFFLSFVAFASVAHADPANSRVRLVETPTVPDSKDMRPGILYAVTTGEAGVYQLVLGLPERLSAGVLYQMEDPSGFGFYRQVYSKVKKVETASPIYGYLGVPLQISPAPYTAPSIAFGKRVTDSVMGEVGYAELGGSTHALFGAALVGRNLADNVGLYAKIGAANMGGAPVAVLGVGATIALDFSKLGINTGGYATGIRTEYTFYGPTLTDPGKAVASVGLGLAF